MNREVYFLKDSEINDWLIESFKKRNFRINFMGISNPPRTLKYSRVGRILKLHIGYIKLSFKCLLRSKKDDVIVSLLDVLAVYLFLISKILFLRREIVVINIMLNNYNDLITKIKLKLFRVMLKSNNIHPTVTSNNLRELYRNLFDLPDKNFHLLHDCYGKLGKYKKPFELGNDYVFCGGNNGRDWPGIVKIAKLIPDVKFVIVGPKKETLGDNLPSNIEYHYDISYEKFQKLIQDCSILALPINTQAPAGLIVLFSAGLMSKPVIITENATTREYITTAENGILIKFGDFEDFALQIKNLSIDLELQKKYGTNLNNKIESLGSPQVFVDNIIKIIEQIH